MDVTESTKAWCVKRGHPFVTYNPWLGQSLCRCGMRREQGDQPQDMQAKREIFHSCMPGGTCRCYAVGKPA